jgi:hypothetical protein
MDPSLSSEAARNPPRTPVEPRSGTLSPCAKLEPGHIRCVRILPDDFPDPPIRCVTRIQRIGLDTEPDELVKDFHYCALSYAWGDPTPRYCIEVDGVQRFIARNLWQFLSGACGKGEHRWFWIDA